MIHVPDADGNGAQPPADAAPAEVAAEAVEETPTEAAESDGEAPPPKKRTRRGTRGRRNRKRKTAAQANGDVAEASPEGSRRSLRSAARRRPNRRRRRSARRGRPSLPEGLRADVRVDRGLRPAAPEPRSPGPDLRYNPAARGLLPRFPRQVTQA